MAIEEVSFSAFASADRMAQVEAATASGVVINFGFINEEHRTEEQNAIHQTVVTSLPAFAIGGTYKQEVRRYALWKGARALLGGRDPYWIWQQTGSCVGAGAGNMQMVTQGVEIYVKKESQQPLWPWWLFTYGRSRFRGGMHGPGEGSFGSAMALALTEDGQFEIDPAGEPDLPNPEIRSGWSVLAAELEMKWSNGDAIAKNWVEFGKKRTFQTASRMRSADDCIAALANGYPITVASMFGFSPTTPAVAGKGENQIRLVKNWNGSWSHQMSLSEFWDHPDVGPIFFWLNNWGPTAHGSNPSDYPTGGFYTTYALVDQIMRRSDTEAFSFSQYEGFPAREEQLRLDDFSPFA